MGLMKEKVGTALANYIGTFMEYDKNNNSSFWRQYMRMRVRIDVRLPLKKDTKVMNKEGKWCTVKFKYEKLGTFCLVCGIMGHAENKCEIPFADVNLTKSLLANYVPLSDTKISGIPCRVKR
jgi:hypothetical protein